MSGQNSLNEVYKREQIRQIEASIQEKIDNYLNELDDLDCLEQKNGVSVNEEKVKSITKRLNK